MKNMVMRSGIKARLLAFLMAAVLLISLAPVSALAGETFTLYFAVPSDWVKANYDRIVFNYHDNISNSQSGWHEEGMSSTGEYTSGGLEIFSVTFDSPTGGYSDVRFKAMRDNGEVHYVNAYTGNVMHYDNNLIWDNGWSDSSSDITIYFAVPTSWSGYNRIRINLKYGSSSYYTPDMTLTDQTYNGCTVYTWTIPKAKFQWGGYHKLQFQAYNGDTWLKQSVYNDSGEWKTDQDTWDGKIFYFGEWLDYVPDSPLPSRTVYFDGRYSGYIMKYYELEHSIDWPEEWDAAKRQEETDKCLMPNPSTGKLYYYASGASGTTKGEMTKVGSSNVFKVDLPGGIAEKIVFSSTELTSLEGNHQRGGSTKVLTIPSGDDPCFFADSNDYIVYNDSFMGGYRGGYWGTFGETRDAEAGKENDVVSVGSGTLTRNDTTYYLKTTLYDYYSDYELSGYNLNTRATHDGNAFRRWYSFRLFDTALSNKYSSMISTSLVPIYTGQFQPAISGWGYQYSNEFFPLYGCNQYYKFMSVNNSTWNAEGEGYYYSTAAQGIVDSRLNGGEVKVKGGAGVLPYFDKSFLTGNNSYNAVIGEVYENVTIPFTRKEVDHVIYWHFDSAETTVALKRSGSEYYLDTVTSSSERDKYRNLNSTGKWSSGDTPDPTYGFFPFNSGASSDNGNTYNFGFGAKMELNFHLTENGKIKGTDGNEHPIVFRFSGDDDLWVFIDGELVLDVGGAHAAVSGEINFADKTTTVSGVKSSWGNSSPSTTENFNLKGKNTDNHTMTIYYMERGMWSSNFKVDFNFPDDNLFVVEESVNAENVNKTLFPAAYATLKNTDFNIGIKNLATHYGTVTTHPVETDGYIVYQREIMDFGSAASGKLESVNGAQYILLTDTTDSGGSGSGEPTVTYSGPIAMKGGQYAVFENEFRRGSYIAVDQSVDTYGDLFKTKWTMYDYDGSEVTGFSSGESVTAGSTTNLVGVEGLKPDDGRTEKIFLEADETSYGTKYQQTGSATAPDNAFVFRSYKHPDGTSRDTSLKLLYENEVKVGSLTVTKAKRDGGPDLTGSYTFTVVFSNVGGHDLEGRDVTETFTLSQGESKTFTGIPEGTTYTVTETGIPDGSELYSVDGTVGATSATGSIEDGVTASHIFANAPETTIQVTKAMADGSDTVTGKFRIIVVPTSGGVIPATYEAAIIDVELAVGESSSVVPAVAGQQYAVIEIMPDSETVLSSYILNGTNTELSGESSFAITAAIGPNAITLNNYLAPYDVGVYVKKLWKNGDDTIAKDDTRLPATLSFKISYTLTDSTVHWLDTVYTLTRDQYNMSDLIHLADLPARVNGSIANYELWELDASGDPVLGSVVTFGENQFGVSKEKNVSADGLSFSFSFANSLADEETVSLKITEKIYGSMGNKQDEFIFTITLSNASKALPESFAVTGSRYVGEGTLSFAAPSAGGGSNSAGSSSGSTLVAEVRLGHDEDITITGIPMGTLYSIVQSTPAGVSLLYETRIGGTDGTDGELSEDRTAQGPINDNPTVVHFANGYDATVPSGVTLTGGALLLMGSALGLGGVIAVRKKKEN